MKAPSKAPVKNLELRKSDPVVHFEMPAKDRKRMAKFYTKAFGWKTQMLGKDMSNYVLATTTADVNKAGRPQITGMINGGFFTKQVKDSTQYPFVIIPVEDVQKSMAKIIKSGGKVIGKPMAIPGFGNYVSFYDTEGNRASIMEASLDIKSKTNGHK